ncbi:MAG TPA: LytTR family DNA-binding domain-containing protein [Candidatus Dormibacteraeota bacterium]|jgi:two-component system LytT family response regulator|nr:LytTR family DNA-binding domain-containing protein [Candidatus Dormibacteraeota bacterium]
MLRTIIADDERLARKKLRILLSSEPGIEIVAECSDGKETLTALGARKPDLLLLDVQMPDMDGFGVLRAIPPDEMPVVIFTTAYDQYAVKAFETHALDYLLKPFDRDRLHSAINRARVEFLRSRDRETTSRILDFLTQNKPEPQVDRRLAFKSGGRVVFLDLDEIDWLSAAANYVTLRVGAESYLLREGIGHISERLDPKKFVRIHRSTIVNVKKIKQVEPVNSGEFIVVLKDGKELSCSRGYRAGLQQLIDKNL